MRQMVLTWRSILGLESPLSATAVTRTKSAISSDAFLGEQDRQNDQKHVFWRSG